MEGQSVSALWKPPKVLVLLSNSKREIGSTWNWLRMTVGQEAGAVTSGGGRYPGAPAPELDWLEPRRG